MFKQPLIKSFTFACLMAAATAQADTRLLSSGGLYADLCVLAAESPAAFESEMRANGLDADALICNGQPVSAFIQTQTGSTSQDEVPSILTAGNDDLLTQVCLKGATGEMAWNDIKGLLPREMDAFNVTCNGTPIRTFIRKHRT